MTKKTTMATCVLLVLTGTVTLHATPIVTVTEFDAGGLAGFTFNVDPNDLTGLYDSIGLDFTPTVASTFSQTGGSLKATMGSGTDTAFWLDLVTVLGAASVGTVDTADQLRADWSVFASNAISNSVLDFADVVLTADGTGGSYEVVFVADTQVIDRVTGTFQIPEPASSTLAAALLAAIGLFARRRTVIA